MLVSSSASCLDLIQFWFAVGWVITGGSDTAGGALSGTEVVSNPKRKPSGEGRQQSRFV